jgi:hypothetical protein
MALIIEDGSQVANADSYVTQADYITYAAKLGITIDAVDATDEQLRKAANFIGDHEANLKGCKVSRDQSMAYPRYDLCIEGFYWASDEIPRQVILAQMNIALDLEAGIDIYNPAQSDSTPVKREKIEGAVEIEYATKESSPLSRRSSSTALMSSLLENNGLNIRLVKR